MPVQQIRGTDVLDSTLKNVDLGSDTARLNLLTNGGFEIWQRGNGPFAANGAYTADRWTSSIAGTGTISVTRDAANADGGVGYCLAGTYTYNAAGSVVYQPSTDSIVQLRGRTATFSMRVKTSTANAVRLIFSDGVVASNSAYHSGGGAYETLTITKVLSGSSTLLNTGVALDASCTFYLDNAMLVVGSVAADYAPMHPADDLARCLRYYEHFEDTQFIMSGSPGAGVNVRALYYYKARKAVTPAVTKVGTWTLSNAAAQPTVSGPGLNFAWLSLTATAAGDCYAWADATGKDLTIEANP